MLREIKVGALTVYPYSVLMILGGALCFVCFLSLSFMRRKEAQDENIFALTALTVSIFLALPAAVLFDALFKMAETGRFALKGATFYGGAVAVHPTQLYEAFFLVTLGVFCCCLQNVTLFRSISFFTGRAERLSNFSGATTGAERVCRFRLRSLFLLYLFLSELLFSF